MQKMAFYRLSESRVKRVLRNPGRTEEGIAPDTNASMRRNDSKKRKEEIWVMWQKAVNKKQLTANSRNEKSKNRFSREKTIIISAWRYPGVSPVGKKIEIPQDTLEFLQKEKF